MVSPGVLVVANMGAGDLVAAAELADTAADKLVSAGDRDVGAGMDGALGLALGRDAAMGSDADAVDDAVPALVVGVEQVRDAGVDDAAQRLESRK